MTTFSFDHLPQAVHEIQLRLERMERLLLQLTKNGLHTEQILTVTEAAEFLNITVGAIYKMTSRGEIPFLKRSKRCYFSKTELISYLEKGRRKSNPEIKAEADAYIRNRRILKR